MFNDLTKEGNGWSRYILFFIALLSFGLSFWGIGQDGYGNGYYAAAVKSMLMGWKNFFFVSFDPAGFVSVDKPALGLWIQSLFALVFGFHGWALILPQALAGAVSVLLLHQIVKKHFGSGVSFIAALALTVTPIFVATNRSNNLDSLLLVLLLWAVTILFKAVETRKLKYLVISMAVVGLGFNVKMLQAYLILPAFITFYLLALRNEKMKVGKLLLSLMVLIGVSLSWAVAVDLFPAEKRPYIGSSQTNSVLELAMGYNGLMRLLPGSGPMRSMSQNPPPGFDPENLGTKFLHMPSGDQAPFPVGGPGGPGMEGGEPGVLRLFNRQLGGQISWFLLLALVAPFIVMIRYRENKKEYQDRFHQTMFWSIWFLVMAVYFSIAGFFHRYYMILLAPAVAALVGISVSELWHVYRERRKSGWFLPIVLFGTLLAQLMLLYGEPNFIPVMVPVVIGVGLSGVVGLLFRKANEKIQLGAISLSLIGLFIAPVVWSLTPIIYGSQSMIPFAGPGLKEMRQMFRGGAMGMVGVLQPDERLITYLQTEQQGEKFLVAVPNANIAAPIILKTGAAVMAVGGFIGSDPILDLPHFQRMVKEGKVRFAMAPDPSVMMREMPGMAPGMMPGSPPQGPGMMPGFSGKQNKMMGSPMMQSEIFDWIVKYGKDITKEITSETAGTGMKLYDLQNCI